MSDPIDDYCEVLRDEFRGLTGRDELVAEIDDHLRESSEALRRAGQEQPVETAIGRLGRPESVARGIRMVRGRPRGTDPMIVPRWPLTVSAALLVLAAVAYAVATWLYQLPCSGPFDELGPATDRCLDRWEDIDLFPLSALPVGFDGLAPSPATHVVFLVACGSMVAATVLLALTQPWFAGTRNTVLSVAAGTLITAVAVAVHRADPTAGLAWWGTLAALGTDLAALCAIVRVWIDPVGPPRFPTPRSEPPPSRVDSYTRYRVRMTLLLFASAGAGAAHVALLLVLGPLVSLTSGISRSLDGGWSVPVWAIYQAHALFIAAAAIAGLLLRRAGRRTSAFRARPGLNHSLGDVVS